MKAEPSAERRQLPIGIQTFSTLRNERCYYVDKTPLIRELVKQGRHYFLSRPRRFGKSLLISTLKSLFEGHEKLFQKLDIQEHWDWSIKYPVVRLSFAGKYREPGGLENNILNQLYGIEEEFDLESLPPARTGPERLQNILRRLHRTTGQQVVVLVDEYDKPILDVLEKPEMAEANRDYLRDFYGVVKDSDEHTRFVFVTGITMFTKVSLFSGLNNLEDISLDPNFSSLCGYTDQDLEDVFAPEMEGLDRKKLQRWYNGYNWLGKDSIYNPYDVLRLFRTRSFEPHWFRTGIPKFLYERLIAKGLSPRDLLHRTVGKDLISTFDIDSIDTDALMFQSGYLTIVGEECSDNEILYRLDYPNYEVEFSMTRGLLRYVTRDNHAKDKAKVLLDLLLEQDFEGFAEKFRANLSGIPHAWHDSADLARYESWYAALLYMSFDACEADVRMEVSSSHGRSDMVLLHGGQVFVIELKVVDNANQTHSALDRALAQIREKKYSEQYQSKNQPIHHVAICFGKEERNILDIRVEHDE